MIRQQQSFHILVFASAIFHLNHWIIFVSSIHIEVVCRFCTSNTLWVSLFKKQFWQSADLKASANLFLKIYLYFNLPYSEASESVDHKCNLVWPKASISISIILLQWMQMHLPSPTGLILTINMYNIYTTGGTLATGSTETPISNWITCDWN